MQRRLTAILSADVAGYSGLMEVDEAGTLDRLKVNRRQIFDPCVAAQDGRVVKVMGDGALVEFGSVVAAVNCALAIQEGTMRAELEFADAKRIRYRIGINLGDHLVGPYLAAMVEVPIAFERDCWSLQLPPHEPADDDISAPAQTELR